MSKLLVTLVHLSFNDPPLPVSLADFLNSQPSITVLVPTTADSTESRLVNPSLSLVHTVLGLLSKRDLINEQSSKYLVQYFQFFNMYTSIGMAQCHHLINADIPFTLMQFALDELPTTVSNVNIFASHSHLSASSSFSLNYAKPSAATATTSTNNNTSNASIYLILSIEKEMFNFNRQVCFKKISFENSLLNNQSIDEVILW